MELIDETYNAKDSENFDYCSSISEQSIHVLKEFIRLSKCAYEYVNTNTTKEAKKALSYMKKLDAFEEELKTSEKEEDEYYRINMYNLQEQIISTAYNIVLIPNSMVISLVSEFEYYLKQLLRIICVEHPHVIKCVDIKIGYDAISTCNDLDEIKKRYIDTFLDGLFRPSLNDIFEAIEKTFKINGIKEITYYKELLLIAELRNIIVHNGGKAGGIFYSNIKKYGLRFAKEEYIKDDQLHISTKTLLRFIHEMIVSSIEICIRFIDHFTPNGYADSKEYLYEISDICLDLLYSKLKTIPLEVFENIIKNEELSPSMKNFYIFNHILSKKVVNRTKIGEEEFSQIDWTCCDSTHYFAQYVLCDNYEKAMSYCSIDRDANWEMIFQMWPLCKPLISSDTFKEKYNELFHHEFSSKIINWTENSKDKIPQYNN